MQVPVEIQFRNVDASEAVETRVRERIQSLERFHDKITSCHVTIESPHRHSHKGQLYEVRIRIGVPGSEVLVNRAGPNNHAHEDVYVAVRDAFDAAQRQLEDITRRRDHRTRPNESPLLHGKVIKHFGVEGYGFVETSDGLEVYFHENSVVDGQFKDLAVGDEVRIELAFRESEHGPQATTIRPIGKHHLVP